MSGEISELEIERALIRMRAVGEIHGLPPALLDQVIDRMRGKLNDPLERRQAPPGPPTP